MMSSRQIPGVEVLPTIQEYKVRDHFSKLDSHKSMELDGMHPKVLTKLANTIVRPLIFERLWCQEKS